VKSSTAGYITEDLIAKREEVRTNIFNTLTSKMKEITQGYIVVDAVNIVNFKFSADYSAAIEAKATAEQKLGEQQRQLEIIKVQAEQKIAEAQGTAQATIANAKAEAEKIKVINEQLKQSPAYVQLQYAQKWDGKLPVYWIGGGGASGSNAFSVLQIPFQSVVGSTTPAGG
jgi:regulator of protease activity HflC (stomatin/prohibitin superfamily)